MRACEVDALRRDGKEVDGSRFFEAWATFLEGPKRFPKPVGFDTPDSLNGPLVRALLVGGDVSPVRLITLLVGLQTSTASSSLATIRRARFDNFGINTRGVSSN
jgi:hypothetical protein